jgi:two-component system phosphate regulon response regulator PhoB
MPKKNILVVDDEEDILELVRYNVEKNGYSVTTAATGEEALDKARAKLPDLVVLDLMLPGVDGLEVCKILKNDPKTSHIPVIMLSAKGEEADVVTGLELGADDYVTKPFSPRILSARIKVVLRRGGDKNGQDGRAIQAHNVAIFPDRHEVLVRGKPVDLTFTEFRILRFLASHPGRVFTRYQIIDSVRGEDYVVTDRSVDVQITGLRKKLGSTAGKLIETVRGVGYRFRD